LIVWVFKILFYLSLTLIAIMTLIQPFQITLQH